MYKHHKWITQDFLYKCLRYIQGGTETDTSNTYVSYTRLGQIVSVFCYHPLFPKVPNLFVCCKYSIEITQAKNIINNFFLITPYQCDITTKKKFTYTAISVFVVLEAGD